MEDLSIIIPSYKRVGKVTTLDIFKDGILAVNGEEEEAYKEAYPNIRLLVLPDSVKGNMAKVRQYIKDNCPTRYLIMCDDDIKEFRYVENRKSLKMSEEQIYNMIDNGFEMMKDLGTVLWGINLNDDRLCYMEYSPFSLLSVILGPFFCMDTLCDISFDASLGLKEDYDFSLQVLQRYHKLLRCNKYSYIVGHIDNEGGCPSYRTRQNEITQATRLQKKWGSRVVKFDVNRSINPIVRVPLKGI